LIKHLRRNNKKRKKQNGSKGWPPPDIVAQKTIAGALEIDTE
jgi:hypothetical protein